MSSRPDGRARPGRCRPWPRPGWRRATGGRAPSAACSKPVGHRRTGHRPTSHADQRFDGRPVDGGATSTVDRLPGGRGQLRDRVRRSWPESVPDISRWRWPRARRAATPARPGTARPARPTTTAATTNSTSWPTGMENTFEVLVGQGPDEGPGEAHADHQPQEGAEQGDDHRLLGHAAAQLAPGLAHGPQQADLPGALVDRQQQGVDHADQGDEQRQRQQQRDDGEQLVDLAELGLLERSGGPRPWPSGRARPARVMAAAGRGGVGARLAASRRSGCRPAGSAGSWRRSRPGSSGSAPWPGQGGLVDDGHVQHGAAGAGELVKVAGMVVPMVQCLSVARASGMATPVGAQLGRTSRRSPAASRSG